VKLEKSSWIFKFYDNNPVAGKKKNLIKRDFIQSHIFEVQLVSQQKTCETQLNSQKINY